MTSSPLSSFAALDTSLIDLRFDLPLLPFEDSSIEASDSEDDSELMHRAMKNIILVMKVIILYVRRLSSPPFNVLASSNNDVVSRRVSDWMPSKTLKYQSICNPMFRTDVLL